MERDEVIAVMESSRTESEWKANCLYIKARCGGYPTFWYEAIVLSGLADQTSARWGGDAAIHVYFE